MFSRHQPPAPSIRDGLARSRVIVTLNDGTGFDGVALRIDTTGVELAPWAGGKVALIASEAPQPLDGHIWIPVEQIRFIQFGHGVD